MLLNHNFFPHKWLSTVAQVARARCSCLFSPTLSCYFLKHDTGFECDQLISASRPQVLAVFACRPAGTNQVFTTWEIFTQSWLLESLNIVFVDVLA